MKNRMSKKFIGLITAILLSQLSNAQVFNVLQDQVQIGSAENSTATFSVASDSYWGIYNVPEWAKSDIKWDSLSKTVTLTAQQNPYTIARTADITVYSQNSNMYYMSDTIVHLIQSASALGVSQTAINLGTYSGSSASFTIKADGYWEIVDIPAWLSVNNNWQSGDGSVTVTAQVINPLYVTRTAIITVHRLLADNTYLSAKVMVNQAPASLGLSTEKLLVGSSCGTTGFSVSENTSWTVAGKADWIVISPSASTGKDSVTIEVAENIANYYRLDTLTIKTANGTTYTLIVVQEPTESFMTVIPRSIQLNSENLSSMTIYLHSNTKWTLAQFPAWINKTDTYGYGDGEISIQAQQNTSSQARTDTILLYWFDAYDVYSEYKIPVTQLGSGNRTTQQIYLQEGWNLISLNVVPNNTSISSLFSGIMNSVSVIKDANGFYDPSYPSMFRSISKIEPGKAYFVYMNAGAMLSVTGTASTMTVNQYTDMLQYGWNLLGCPMPNALPVERVFDGVSIVLVKNLDGFYIPDYKTNSIQAITPTYGYWIYK